MKLFGKFLVLALISGALCSCDKDNDGTGGSYNPKPVSVKISYSYENTADFFSLFDVDIEYIDANGDTKKGTFTNNAWKYEATVDYNKAPANYKCKITVHKKDVEPEDRNYNIMGLGSIELKVFTINDDNNKYLLGPSVTNIKSISAVKNMSEFLKLVSDNGTILYDYEYTLKK